MNEIQILQEKICFLYETNVVKKWVCDLDKANLFVEHSNSKDVQASLLKNDIQLRKSLSNLQPHQRVLSAFLFCIECKKHNKTELKTFISNSMYNFVPLFLTNDVRCQNSFSFIIMELNLGTLFPLQVVFGFVQYLTLSKVKEQTKIKLEPFNKTIHDLRYYSDFLDNYSNYLDKVEQFMHLLSFFPTVFSNTFMEKCQSDCMRLGNLGPVSLALKVLYIKSISHKNYTIFVYDKNQTFLEFNKNLASKELEIFKKQLIHSKLVTTKFILKCNFSFFYDKQEQRKMPFQDYYSSFYGLSVSESLSQDLQYALLFPFLIGVGGLTIAWTASGLTPPPYMTLHRNEPTTAASAASTTSLRASMRPNRAQHVASAGKQYSMPTLWGVEDQSGTGRLVKVDIVSLGEGYVERKNTKYAYQRVMVNGQLCFSTLGTAGIYGDMETIMKEIRQEILKILPDHKDIMEVICELTGDKTISLSFDHTGTSYIRKIFKIPMKDGYTFAVPGLIVNGVRTNNQIMLLSFSEYDMRPDPANVKIGDGSPFNGKYTFRELYQEALQLNFEMWLRRIQLQQPEMFPFVQFFRTPMYNGFLACMDNDLVIIDDFFRGLGSSVDETESVLIFQHEALVESKWEDIRELRKRLYLLYDKTETQIITKCRTIEVFLKSAALKYKLGCSLQNLTSNQKFWHHAEIQKIELLRETKNAVQGCLDVYRNSKGSDAEIARIKTALANFDQEIAASDLFSAEQCQYLINTHIKLGNFYRSTEQNGRICDYTVLTARRDAKLADEDISLYVQDNKNFLQPAESFQTVDDRNMYAALDKCDSNNLLEQLKIRETYMSKPVLEKTIINFHYHDENHYYQGISVPNPDPDVQAWIEQTLSPETIAILTEQTKISKPQPNKALKSHPIKDFDPDLFAWLDVDKVERVEVDLDTQRAQHVEENWQKLSEGLRRAQQFSAPPYPVPDAEPDATQRVQRAQENWQKLSERIREAQQFSAPPYVEQGAAQVVQQDDEQPSAPPYVEQGTAQGDQQDDEQPSAPPYVEQGAAQGDQQANEQQDDEQPPGAIAA